MALVFGLLAICYVCPRNVRKCDEIALTTHKFGEHRSDLAFRHFFRSILKAMCSEIRRYSRRGGSETRWSFEWLSSRPGRGTQPTLRQPNPTSVERESEREREKGISEVFGRTV